MSYQYQHLACGGTFDLLHKGHQQFLRFAFARGKKVSVGIATDNFAGKNSKSPAQDFDSRVTEVKNFLIKKGLLARAQIVTLDDIYGTTVSDETIDGLVVTRQTIPGGRLINSRRRELKLSPLKILVAPMVWGDDHIVISTTRVRQGLIDREGNSYYKFLMSRSFVLPQTLRKELSKPLGEIKNKLSFDGSREFPLIAVGDQTTINILKAGRVLDLAVVDFKIQRQNFSNNLKRDVTVKNSAGTITRSLIRAIKKYFFLQTGNSPYVIRVIGEEDLAVLPAVLLAPLGSTVVYGQRNQGMVLVSVTEEKKSEILNILKRFD